MSFYNIVFSPTGGTKKVSDLFTKSFCSESTQIDLSDRNKDFSAFSFHEEDICIISVPSYGGRVPAIAEHSIMHQFATGRPDPQDEKQLANFAASIHSKIKSETLPAHLKLPRNRPYREYNGVPMKPQTGKSCIQCGVCAKGCPVGAIPTDNPSKTNTEQCISCMRCIVVCPQKARSVNKILLTAASIKMKKTCSDYKQNELFL